MKILHIFKITGISGFENHLLTLLPNLVEKGIEILVIMLIEPNCSVNTFSTKLKQFNISIEKVEIKRHVSVKALWRIKTIIKNKDPDIVHTHLVHGDMYGTIATILNHKQKRPIISTKHNDNKFRKRFIPRIFHAVLNSKIKAVIVISKALKGFYEKYEMISPEKISVIYYGLDDFENKIKDKYLRSKLGYTHDHIVFGIVARLTEQKGHTYLLKALKKVTEINDKVKLLVVGSGELDEELKKLSQELSIDAHVNFMGNKSNTADIYNALDIFVHPSLWEGFGLVFLEAMSFSLPVISTKVSAIPEIVVNNETGLLVPAKNTEGLAHAMIHMMNSSSIRQQMGRKGYKRAKTIFSVDKMVFKTINIYKHVLNEF